MLVKLMSAALLLLVILQSCTANPLIGYYLPAPIRHYPPVMPPATLFIPRPATRLHYHHQFNSFDGPSIDYAYALELLSHWKPTKEQIAVNYFAFSDTNLDGMVTEAEMAVTFLKLGLSLDDADLMSDKIKIYDSNGDGSLESDEFEKMVQLDQVVSMFLGELRPLMHEEFDWQDVNGDTYVEMTEMEQFYVDWGIDDALVPYFKVYQLIRHIYNTYDTNADGLLSLAEFQKYYQKVKYLQTYNSLLLL